MATNTTPAESTVTFPKDFLWGAATSAHQVEGNTHNQWTVWELENAKSLAAQAPYKVQHTPRWDEIKPEATDPNNYISGNSTDHYNRYEEDFVLMRRMHFNAFRFGIEWSRIEPQEGVWDIAAIQHYREYLQSLRAHGIDPMVTLFHWTMPVWFADKGGFEHRANVKYFVRFAEKVFMELGTELSYICTINEPEVYVAAGWGDGSWPPGKQNYVLAFWTYMNLAHAHNKVAKLAHKMNRRLKVGLSKNCAHNHPGDDRLTSKLAAKGYNFIADYLFLNRTTRNMDWLGLNYYFSNSFKGFKVENPDEHVNDMGWDMRPDDMQFVIERLYKKYKLPIIVTESGVADGKDMYRKWWVSHSITAMHKAMANGAKVSGYLHWSLLDNFEWAYGKWPRFGLIHVDYETLKRTPKPSAVWYGQVIKKLRG